MNRNVCATTAPRRLRLGGAAIVVVGLIAASVVFWRAAPDEYYGILGVDIPTKRDTLQLERMGGKSYILFNELNDWFASLWHGRRLAYTIGVLSVATFLACRRMADLLEHPPVDDEPGPKDGRA